MYFFKRIQILNKKNFHFFLFGGDGARVSEFFTKNLNKKSFVFFLGGWWVGGWGGGGGGGAGGH